MAFVIEDELKKLPGQPGVYIMHDKKDEIIYVGKAISLKNRVRQYFQSSKDKSPKIKQMVSKIERFEYIVTDSELEALVLENNLIKENRPRYNTMLRDDKTYPYIKLTVKEEYPRLQMVRQIKKDKNRYFGPFSSGNAVRDTINLLNRVYKLRTCSRNLPKDIGAERPCLDYFIHQCDAPCQNYISKEDYNKNVVEALKFLSGDFDPIINKIREEMERLSSELKFEDAAKQRDLLNSVLHITQKQKITSDDRDAVVQVFFIREGKMVGREHHYIQVAMDDEKVDILESFIKQFYAGTPFVPSQIMSQYELKDNNLITEWLSSKRGSKVSIIVPKKGSKEKLVELAKKNAEIVLTKDREKLQRQEARSVGAVKEIEELLSLSGLSRMEAYDISNISGVQSVGSMVVYENGIPKKSDYRKFKIKTVIGPNDYASMKEVLTRRFENGIDKNDTGFNKLPDIILMDGGRGQVNICLQVLEEFGLNIPVCGMVKDDNHRTRGLYYNNVEIPIDTHSQGFLLITRIQDEAHRFAIEYHRSLRSKTQVKSILDDIEGIGTVRRKALMKHFKDIENIKNASPDELMSVDGMNKKSAKAVYEFFSNIK